jgi:Domain of unknown function (DUF4159)
MFHKSVGVVLVLVLFAAPLHAQPREPLVEQVRKAIERGVQFLRDQEEGQGNWEHVNPASGANPGGWTALALLALLNAGVKPDDPLIERGLQYLRQLKPGKTYVVGLQTMVFAEAGLPQDRERIQRNVDWLIAARVTDGGQLRGWTYTMSRSLPDNSNTQYALLGLHAGQQAGAHIQPAIWREIRDYYVRTQQPDHGWIYNPALPGTGTSLTMTVAGLSGLIIAGQELNEGRQQLNHDGSAVNCGVYPEDRSLANALAWVGRHFRIELPSHTFYSLYGIERAGRLSGQRFLGEHDWYRRGCTYLVQTQKDNGSWVEYRSHGTGPPVTTSFALLFLSKGRTPILLSKLVHGPGEDWNNKHNDCRNLVAYAGRELFHRQPMAWQIFDARQVAVRNADERRDLVADLLQSPIAYFNGHEVPRFTDVEMQLLREYLDQGGFLLAEACCGRPAFDQGFRKLMKDLFPDHDLKPLPPEHPIWRAHAVVPPNEFKLEGIEMGCKTVVVYSPQPLAGWWEANLHDKGRGQLAFRMAGNIIAYATGMEPPKPRLTEVEVVRGEDQKQVPRGYLKVAQLRHEGDWQPAPRAMRNLLLHLRDKAKLDAALQTEPLRPSHPDLIDFKFLYMHGRSAFTLTDAEVKNVRADLETGGLLLADACCGRSAFDQAFRAFAAKLFPDKKLEAIPLDDDLYSKDVNGTAITAARCRTEAAGPGGGAAEFREMPPALEGIKLNNRWVVIYSRYDLGCALEKHQSTDCLGHDHASALRLAGAAVLYALKR